MKKIDAEKRIKKVISKSDIIIEVLDARFIQKTRNKKYELMIKNRGKELIVCANKSELLKYAEIQKLKKLHPHTIFLSAHSRKNLRQLRTALSIARKRMKRKRAKVGIIGYANTGKSSLINALKGRHTARTAKFAGFTRGEQYFRISETLLLIDSPGTIFDPRKSELDMFLINAKNIEQLKDVVEIANKLIKLFGLEESLEKIAEEKGFKQKGGELDIDRAAIFILQRYQNNKLRYVEIK